MVKRYAVHSFIYPALLRPCSTIRDEIKDQFALRPTDSTTAAVIDILQQITTLLQDNNYVVVISLDYSKVFDTIWPSSLLHKMDTIDLPDDGPDHIYNCLVI